LVIILAFILLFSPASAFADDLADLAAAIDGIREQHELSAAAVIVVDADEILLEHYSGITDWESQNRVTAETYFRVGSVSKAFTGLALLRAEQLGLVKLDQKVSEILPVPQYQNPWEETNPLLVAQLMEHSAGWFDMSRLEFDSADGKPLTAKEALAIRPQSRQMQWPPGWHSEYSNSSPGLLSYVIEVATGSKFDGFIDEQVFNLLGMESASLLWSPEIEKSRATGYDTDGRSIIPYWHIIYRASGGMNVLPRDMAKFLQMLLNSGRPGGRAVFTAEQVSRFETPKTTLAAQAGLEYGYGLGVYTSLHKKYVLFGHGGDADGYLAQFSYSRDSGKGYFVVINAFNHAPLNAMEDKLNDFLVAGLPEPLMPDIPDVDPEILERYVGKYRPASVRFPRDGWQDKSLQVKLDGDRLLTRENGRRWRRLVPVNEQQFRRGNEPVATAAFIAAGDGSMVLQGRMGNWIRD
jgi:CubicO group peptidase (beta-lactamase class C family)